MRIASLQRMGESAGHSLRRFPLALAAAVTAAVTAMAIVDDRADQPWLVNLLLTAQLGIPLFIAFAVTAERRGRLGLPAAAGAGSAIGTIGLTRAIGAIGGVLLLVAYYFSLPSVFGEAEVLRYVQLNVAAHLAVSVLPYFRQGETNGFWQYNRILLLRFVTAAFFSGVLYAGLAIALLAVRQLLGVDVDDIVFARLWCGIAFVFNTWYFVGGLPERLDELETVDDYSKVIRVFGQYILAPLVVVYLAIMTVYLVKVVVTAEWPSGWIGYLVSSVAVAGIFSLLLLYPLSERKNERWVQLYARIFHVLLGPAVIMLLMAIGKRVDQYGWTEKRYLLAVLAVWLAGVAIVGLVRGRHYIKVIPATLGLIAVLTAFGPWGAASVSRHSQLGRLDTMLTSYDRLADGQIVTNEHTVPLEDRREISAILSYLFGQHGPDVLADRTGEALQAKLDEAEVEGSSVRYRSRELVEIVTDYMNVPFVSRWEVAEPGWHHFVREPESQVIAVSGFDYSVDLGLHWDVSQQQVFGNRSYRVTVDRDLATVAMIQDTVTAVTLQLKPMLQALLEHEQFQDAHTAPAELLEATATGDSLRVKLLVADISWRGEQNDEFRLENLRATLLIAFGD